MVHLLNKVVRFVPGIFQICQDFRFVWQPGITNVQVQIYEYPSSSLFIETWLKGYGATSARRLVDQLACTTDERPGVMG